MSLANTFTQLVKKVRRDASRTKRASLNEIRRRTSRNTPVDLGQTRASIQQDENAVWIPGIWSAMLEQGLYTNGGVARWRARNRGELQEKRRRTWKVRNKNEHKTATRYKTVLTTKGGFSNRAEKGIVAPWWDGFVEVVDAEWKRNARNS